MSDTDGSVVEPLLRVTRGASVVVAGTLAGMALVLGGRALFARAFGPEQYGLYSIAFTVAAFLTVVATLGLRSGITRQIAFHGAGGGTSETADEPTADDRVHDPGTIVLWGLLATLVAGVATGAALYLGADALASGVFGRPRYARSLRVAALALPSLGVVYVLTATFRGFSRTRERVAFQELLMKASFPLLLVGVVALGYGFEAALLAFPASLLLTAVVYLAFALRDDPGNFRSRPLERLRDVTAGVDLLRFSAPLLFASLLIQVMTWTDVLMLGYFADARTVGVYDSVRPLVRVVPVIWGSMIFMYTPVVSELHADGATGRIRRAYFVLTKWFASATFPFILVFVLFPRLALTTVFGPAYAAGAPALQVLAAAYFYGNLTGPNGATLTAIGRTRVVMYANLAAAVANVAFNIALVPRFGLVGAAVATGVALGARNTLRAGWLYRATGAHSFHRPMLLPMALTAAIAGVGAAAVHGLGLLKSVPAGLCLVGAFGAVAALYVGLVRATDNVAVEDRALLAGLRERVAAIG